MQCRGICEVNGKDSKIIGGEQMLCRILITPHSVAAWTARVPAKRRLERAGGYHNYLSEHAFAGAEKPLPKKSAAGERL